MTITKEVYVDIEEKFLKITKLMEEDSKCDPPSDPYHSKYNARQLLVGVKANIENLRRSQPAECKEYVKLTAMLSLALYYLAKIAMDTEELATARKHIVKCLETIDTHQAEPEFIIITLSLLNLQALLNSNNEPETSKSDLDKCISLYKEFTLSEAVPVNISDLYKVNIGEYNCELASTSLEKAHTLTLYYLAQIYGTLKEDLKSSVYCHMTLKRQLQYNDYEPIEWSLNSATLSQFFTEKNCFKQARHHLAASSFILQRHETQLNSEPQGSEEHEAQLENLKHRSADVARCWAKYGLALLSTSKERLLNQADDKVFDLVTDLSHLELLDTNFSHLANLEFDLDLQAYETQVSADFALTLDDARLIFLNIKSWLSKAHEYYTLNTLASDYIEIVLDQSQMYLNLLFFDDDSGNQAKLHKRRADLLEDVLQKINPTYYLSYCRQLWYETADIYRDIFYIKMEKLQEIKGHPAPHILTKINNLLHKSLTHSKNFIKSFEDAHTHELPKTIDENYQKPVLLAFFNVGALSSRYVTFDKRLILEHTEASYNAYKYLTDYCDANPQACSDIPAEIKICREMVMLLPIKIGKLQNEILS